MTNRKLGITLTGLAIIALLAVLPFTAYAQTPAIKPSIPEFKLEVVDFSYDVSPTSVTDSYTGEVRTVPGYHVENKTIKLSIKNQPTDFTVNGSTYHTFLDIRRKPHFEDETKWNERGTFIETWQSSPTEKAQYINSLPAKLQSDSEYTVFWYSEEWEPNAQIDFQVQALRGHDAQAYSPNAACPGMEEHLPHYYDAIAYDTSSGWSETQTVTIPAESFSLTGLVWTWENTATVLGGAVVVLLVVIVMLLLYIKRNIRLTKRI